MLQEQDLVSTFLQWLAVLISLYICLNIPFVVERMWPRYYRGYIAWIGNILRSPRWVLALMSGQVIGLLLGILFLFVSDI